jgi:hypothetical protein
MKITELPGLTNKWHAGEGLDQHRRIPMEEKIEILYANNNDTVFPAFVVVNDADLFYFQTGQEFLEWKTPSELAASH